MKPRTTVFPIKDDRMIRRNSNEPNNMFDRNEIEGKPFDYNSITKTAYNKEIYRENRENYVKNQPWINTTQDNINPYNSFMSAQPTVNFNSMPGTPNAGHYHELELYKMKKYKALAERPLVREASPILTKEEYKERKTVIDRRSNSSFNGHQNNPENKIDIRKENLFIANAFRKDVKLNKENETGSYIKHTQTMSRDIPECFQNTMKYFGTEAKEARRREIRDLRKIRPTVFGSKPIEYQKQPHIFVKESAQHLVVSDQKKIYLMDRVYNRSVPRKTNEHTCSFDWNTTNEIAPLNTSSKIGRVGDSFLAQKVPDEVLFKKIGERDQAICTKKLSSPIKLDVKIGHPNVNFS